MIVSHESNYGAEYHVRVVLNACDIEGIAERMHSAPGNVDGRVLALFLRTVALEAMKENDRADVAV